MGYLQTSVDDIGISSGQISFDDLRTWFGKSGSISLGDISGSDTAVPNSIPASGNSNSISNYYSSKRILEKIGVTQEITSSNSSFSPRESSYVAAHVWVVGAGAGGGTASTDSGREAVASGGGAGGVAFRAYSSSEMGSSGVVTIGAAGQGFYRSGDSWRSGSDGGETSFNPAGSTVTVAAEGGIRGFASRQGADDGPTDTFAAPDDADPTNPDRATGEGAPTYSGTGTPVSQHSASSATVSGYNSWGGCSRSEGGNGIFGSRPPGDHPGDLTRLATFRGGQANGFNAPNGSQSDRNHGSDAAGVTGGGSCSFGYDYGTDSQYDGRNGLVAGGYSAGTTAQVAEPTKPTEWESDISTTFRGGIGNMNQSGSSALSRSSPYYGGGVASATGKGGGGGGGVHSTSGAVYSGDGAPGAVYVTYYKVAGT